ATDVNPRRINAEEVIMPGLHLTLVHVAKWSSVYHTLPSLPVTIRRLVRVRRYRLANGTKLQEGIFVGFALEPCVCFRNDISFSPEKKLTSECRGSRPSGRGISMAKTGILLIDCPDRKGIVAAVAEFLYRHNANILHADQHQDAQQGLFLMRVEW